MDYVEATLNPDQLWELPAIGTVGATAAVLIRPDGYVAWMDQGDGDRGVTEALTKWVGRQRGET